MMSRPDYLHATQCAPEWSRAVLHLLNHQEERIKELQMGR
jgi:hypothetical protein